MQGSIRFEPEINHGANAGLVNALKLLEPIKAAHPTVGWADLMQMGSACAVECCGGPKIDLRYGRVTAEGPDACPAEGNLPGMSHSLRLCTIIWPNPTNTLKYSW